MKVQPTTTTTTVKSEDTNGSGDKAKETDKKRDRDDDSGDDDDGATDSVCHVVAPSPPLPFAAEEKSKSRQGSPTTAAYFPNGDP